MIVNYPEYTRPGLHVSVFIQGQEFAKTQGCAGNYVSEISEYLEGVVREASRQYRVAQRREEQSL